MHRVRKEQRGKQFVVLWLSLLMILAAVISMNWGVIRLNPWEVIQALAGSGDPHHQTALFDFRLPRIVLALLIGAGLAVSGAILQAVTRNVLADPGIVGIHAGAGLAVAAYLLFFSAQASDSVFILPVFALMGGVLAALSIYLLAWKEGSVTPTRLLLMGIGLSLLFDALLLLLQTSMAPEQFMLVEVWLAGSIWGASWKFVFALLPWIGLLLPVSFYKARVLDVLALGDPVATGLGNQVGRERWLLLVVSVGLAASCVAIGGGIAFVGLLAPHMARRLVGPGHGFLLPTAALLGGFLLILADTLARNLMDAVEIPVGIVVAIIGVPYFLYLLTKAK